MLALTLYAGGVFAQDAAGGTEGEAVTEGVAAQPSAISEERQKEIDRFDMEVRVSTLSELAEWCRALNLSEAGTREELIARLREAQKMPARVENAPAGRVITIESARATEYFTVDEVNEDYARLSGGVVLSLQEKNATYRISAREILYNRTRNIISAEGGVSYDKQDGDTRESFKGESFTLNLDTWAGTFLDSISERSVAGASTAYRFTGEIISQSGEEVSVLKKAVISNSTTGDPYWSLAASRLWLLPGTDWALFNAVLKVGEIPVMWVPAFFWPSDEFAFHPVLGTRTREGAFFQTTTYIWGASKGDAGQENSISKIMGSGSNMDKKREGLFLRTTGKKTSESNPRTLSISFDGYANLGFYIGSDLKLPAKGAFSDMEFSGGLALSRNVYSSGGRYTPFIGPDGNVLDRDWNNSRLPLLPVDIPLRYRFVTQGSYTKPLLSLRWAFPLYSDASINSDFYLNRSENFDWFSLLKGDLGTATTANTASIGTYSWNIAANSNIPVDKLKPYVSSLSISNLSTNLEFQNKSITSAEAQAMGQVDSLYYANGNYIFYAPYKWTVYSLGASTAGTLLTLGTRTQNTTKETESTALNEFGAPRSPWDGESAAETQSAASGSFYDMSPRALAQTFSAQKDSGLKFTFDYRFAPSSAAEMNFRTNAFKSREAVDWSNIEQKQVRFNGNGGVTFALSDPNNGLFSTSVSFSGTAETQKSEYVPEDDDSKTQQQKDDEEKRMKDLRISDYTQTRFTTSYQYSASLKPLYWHDIFGGSSLSYSLGGKLFRSEFDSADYNANYTLDPSFDSPVWNYIRGEWTRDGRDKKDGITSHSLSASINAALFDKTQTLTLSSSLPPLYQNYSYNLALRFGISETSVAGSIQERAKPNQPTPTPLDPETEMKVQPITFTESLNFGTNKTFSQNIVYDPDPDVQTFTSAVTNARFDTLSVNFTANRAVKYTYDNNDYTWKQIADTAPTFNPVSLSVTYAPTLKKDKFFKDLLSYSLALNTSLFLDLQRYNLSRFTFGLNTQFSISRFLDITLRFESENTSLYKYLQNIPGFEIEGVRVSGESNIFADLINSFDFSNIEKRRASGFKMRSFALSLIHHLGDWDAALDIRVSPYQDTTSVPRVYKFNTEIGFYVKWVPISEIKTELSYDERYSRWTSK